MNSQNKFGQFNQSQQMMMQQQIPGQMPNGFPPMIFPNPLMLGGGCGPGGSAPMMMGQFSDNNETNMRLMQQVND